jgi:DNA repair photolyase
MRYIDVKTILTSVKNPPESFFGGYYNMNLYRGCMHGCIYCDTRSDCYNIGDLTDIRVKKNALNILKKELSSKKQIGTITTGSMNDPYMLIEKKIQLTRNALKLISSFNFGVHIITKSDLVLRDIDILKQLSETYCAVTITITTFDDNLSSIIEPDAPLSSCRFDAIKQLNQAGIYSGIIISPTLPFITDSIENIEKILLKAKDVGASYVMFYPSMTLRDSCRKYYYDKLDAFFPDLKEKYQINFGNNYFCNSLNANILNSFFNNFCKKNNIATKMNFFYPKKYFQKQTNLNNFF